MVYLVKKSIRQAIGFFSPLDPIGNKFFFCLNVHFICEFCVANGTSESGDKEIQQLGDREQPYDGYYHHHETTNNLQSCRN